MSKNLTSPDRDQITAKTLEARTIIDFLSKSIDPGLEDNQLTSDDLFGVCLILNDLSNRMTKITDELDIIEGGK